LEKEENAEGGFVVAGSCGGLGGSMFEVRGWVVYRKGVSHFDNRVVRARPLSLSERMSFYV